MADQTPAPEKMLAIPLTLAQALANYIRSNPSTQAVDVPMQLLAGLQNLQPLEPPKPAKPSTPLGKPTKPQTAAKKKAIRKARRP